MVNSALGLNGKQLMTNPAPGQYVIAYQDASGKNSIWKASLEDDIFAFTVSVIFHRERRDNGIYYTQVPKVFDNVFLFVGLTIFGTFIKFDWLVN